VELRTVGQPNLDDRQVSAQRRYDRQVLALGETAQALLGSMTVGVVGVGGLGSHVVQQLAHLGVGQLVVVDDDTVDDTNLSRLVGGRASDAAHGLRKTQVSSRLSRLLGGQTVVHRVDGSVLDEEEARRLMQCDVVFGCTDTQWSRLVLNALAFQYYIPVIDCGVELQAGAGAIGGRVSWLAPGRRCLWCIGILDGERIRAEQLPSALAAEQARHGYIPDLTVPAPAVVSINGVVASVAVTEFLARITRFAGDDERADLLVYRLADGTIRRVRGAACPECPVCGPAGTFGCGDLAPAPWRPTALAENHRPLGRR
jgi:molybdopterin/thiamine biosynthesis adenylyltransferase